MPPEGSNMKPAQLTEEELQRRSAPGGNSAMKVTRRTELEDLPDLLTPEEFRAYLGIGRTTVYELIRSGELPIKRFGRRVWIPKEILMREC